MNTCPVCERTWEPLWNDTAQLPFCGHYDEQPEGEYLCEPCVVAHLDECDPVISLATPARPAQATEERDAK